MKNSSLQSLKAYMSDESDSSDNQKTDERNKSNELHAEHSQELGESVPATEVNEKTIHSSIQDTTISRKYVKKQFKQKHSEKNSKKKHRENISTAKCYETKESEEDISTPSLKQRHDSSEDIPAPPLKLSNSWTVEDIYTPSLKQNHTRSEGISAPSLSLNNSWIEEDISTPSLKQNPARSEDISAPSLKLNNSWTVEDISTSLKQSRSWTVEDTFTPSLKQNHSWIVEDISTPSLKQSHSRTKGDISTRSLKEIHSSTENLSTPPSKRSHSRIEENSSNPSLSQSDLICGLHQTEDKRGLSTNLSILDKCLSSVPSPEHLSSGETLLPISFYKMVPPPSLKRNRSLMEEDSENNNKHLFQNSTDNQESFNFASSDSPIIRGRRSLPAKTREDFSSYSPFYSSTSSSQHSSSFQSQTPKRPSSPDSSRRHSYHDRYSPRSTYRSCATDQTPYSPADSFRRNKRFKSDLPSYNASDILTFQSDVGFIDSHCHLDFLFDRQFYNGSFKDYRTKNKDTFPVSFKGCIAIFCNPPTFKRERFWQDLLAEENVWASFGCHPHFSKHYNDEVEESLIRALDHPKVCALGEIGLDYSRKNDCLKDVQEKVFMRQLKIALKKKLPLVIHCRDAHEDGMKIMKRMVPKNYFIHLHCFSDTWEIASKWLEEFPNLYIGLTNLVTFPSAAEVHEVARKISLSRLLLETDAPYFIPRPLTRYPSQPKYSHPGMAIHVAAQIAALKEEPLELVLLKTRQNTKAVYKI